jgi:excisionase family DNA binding protein
MLEPQVSRSVSMHEAAVILHVSDASIRRYIARGELKAYRIGGLARIRLVDLAGFQVADPILPQTV